MPEQTLLAERRGSPRQFILATLPVMGVLAYYLFEVARRPSLPMYNMPEYYTDDEFRAAVEASDSPVSLMDTLIVFLVFLVVWTTFAVYSIVFIAKRRHLIGRYLAEGEACLGDVIYDKQPSKFCLGFREYGYCVYAHPQQRKLIRKRVRVYQNYTRERVTILRLPNRPLSGQCKVDLEIDLGAATRERDTSLKDMIRWSLVWVTFTLFGSIFTMYQIHNINNPDDGDPSSAFRVFVIIVGLNVPIAFALNWVRFLMYRNWMINRGAVIEGQDDARKVDAYCLNSAESQDGSDVIPYSILTEEDMSYQGTLPSHSDGLIVANPHDPNSHHWVST